MLGGLWLALPDTPHKDLGLSYPAVVCHLWIAPSGRLLKYQLWSMVKMFPKYPTLVQVSICTFFNASTSIVATSIKLTSSVFRRLVRLSYHGLTDRQLDNINISPIKRSVQLHSSQNWSPRLTRSTRRNTSPTMGKASRQNCSLVRPNAGGHHVFDRHAHCSRGCRYQYRWRCHSFDAL
jgi:hypothetical protein